MYKKWETYVSDDNNADKCSVCTYKKIRKVIFRPIFEFFKTIFLFPWQHINVLLFALLCAFAVASICLASAHIIRICGGTPHVAIEVVPNFVLKFFDSNVETLIEKKLYTVIIADMIAICAFGFAVLPVIQGIYYKRQYARKYLKEQGMKTSEVKKKGEDIATMLRYYKGAERITIFCGSFDWLCEYPNMKHFIEKFTTSDSNKLKLISYRPKNEVFDAFKEQEGGTTLFELLMGKKCFIFNNGLNGVKCSLIKRGGTETRFLFMRASDSESTPFNTCVLSSTDQSRALLHILRELTEPIHWEERKVPPTG
ncbi:MAG: hypothetical protein FVQ80_02130 [Planctomycetes bacterium]|nr:hypothetical protein [Planctomycetota bacterium]